MNKYEQIQQIGRGSFGVVYKCRLKYTGYFVALKVISMYGKTYSDLDQLKKEIQIQQTLKHPNIIRFYESFEEDNNIIIVSELAQTDLFEICQVAPLPMEQVQQIAYYITSVLRALHALRIVHRDVKPYNVLVTSNGYCKLCDFGFARYMSLYTLNLQSLKGSPIYLAPEIAKNYPYDAKSDIWSLGIMLFELAAGKPPFVAKDLVQLIAVLYSDGLYAPFDKYDVFKQNPYLKSFIEHCLRRNPDKRYSTEQLMAHPFVCNSSPNLLLVKSLGEVEAYRDWYGKPEFHTEESYSEEEQQCIPYYQQEYYAKVEYSPYWRTAISDLTTGFEEEFPLFKVLLDMMERPTEIDSIFACQLLAELSKQRNEDFLDYEYLRALTGAEYRHLKLEFLIYLLTKTPYFYFRLILALADYRNYQLTPQQLTYVVILTRTICLVFGLPVQFDVPIYHGKTVSFPFDICFAQDTLQIPINYEEKIKFVGNISGLANLLTVLSKEKHLVDAFEIIVCLFNNNVVENMDRGSDLYSQRSYLLLLLLTAMQGLLNTVQLLYIQYIPYLRPANRVIVKNRDEEMRKSINYDVNVLEIQAQALPQVGKVKLPDFFKYYDKTASGAYYFYNLNIRPEKTEFTLNVIVKLILHFQDHIPKMASFIYDAFKKTNGIGVYANIQEGIEQIFAFYYEWCLNYLYGLDSQNDEKNMEQLVSDVAKNGYAGIFYMYACDINTRLLGLAFTKIVYTMVLDCYVLLPLLLVRKYPIPAILNYRRFFLFNEQSEFDFVADIDALLTSYKKIFMLQNALNDRGSCAQLSNILANYKVLLQTVFSMLPFLQLYNQFILQKQESEDDVQINCTLQKLNQEYYSVSIYFLSQIISPDILALLPHCSHLYKDRFPSFWYSEYIKKITQEKQFVISEDNLKVKHIKSLCEILQDRNLPRRGHYIITHATLITGLENMKNLNLPCSTKFVRNGIAGNNIYHVIYMLLTSFYAVQGSLKFVLAQTMLGGLVYYDGTNYKAFLKFLTVSINMHAAVDMGATQLDFLYQGAPHYCVYSGQDDINETLYEEYYNNAEFRVKFLQIVVFYCKKNPHLCQQVIETRFQSGAYEISYIVLLTAQILWLTSSHREEECRLALLAVLLSNCPSLAFKAFERDMEEIRTLTGQDNLEDYVILRHLLGRILVFIKAQTETYLATNEVFGFEVNYNLQMGADLAQGSVLDSPDQLFKYPYYYLSSGSRIVLPLVNEVVENDIQMDAILRCVQIVSVLLEQYFDFGEAHYQIVSTLVMALEKTVECMIVEAPLFASDTIEPYTQGFLDPVFQFLALVPPSTPRYLALLNKALIIASLALDNSVQAAAQAAFSPPIHKNVKPGVDRHYYLICALMSCPTCLYNINNACYNKENQVFVLLDKLDALQQNRNYSFVFFNWAFLYSPKSISYLTKIVENLLVFFGQTQTRIEYAYSYDIDCTLAISELTRLLATALSKQYISTQLCMPDDLLGGGTNVENMFMLITRTLFGLDSLFQDPSLFPLMLLEYGLPESLLHAVSYFKKPKSLQFAFALIFRFLQQSSQYVRRLFANQFAFSGALLSDYKNDLLAVEEGAAKHLAIGEYIGIVGQIIKTDRFYADYLKSVFDNNYLYKLFAMPQLHVYLFALAAALSKFTNIHYGNLVAAVNVAQSVLRQPTADKLVLLYIFNFFHEAAKWPTLAPQIVKLLPNISKYANSTFDDLEIRYSAFLAIAGLSRTQFAEVQKLQLPTLIRELIRTVDKVKMMHYALCDGLIILKQTGCLDEVVMDEIRRRFGGQRGIPVIDALLE